MLIAGDSGAPLETDEISAIEEAMPAINCLLSGQSLNTIKKNGVAVIDADGDLVTPLNNGKECAFMILVNGVAAWAIEKSWEKGKCKLLKPVSCHLYPVRIKKYSTFTAVNYDEWDICKPALHKGSKEGIRVFEFAKSALIRKFGEEWYNKLCIAAKYILKKTEC